jgi:GGDEF domain-containing protein
VILEGHDLEHRDELIARFRETAAQEEEKKPWRNMSAALGCQAYDRTRHHHFADVYKEADAEMYRNKTDMKKGRNKA